MDNWDNNFDSHDSQEFNDDDFFGDSEFQDDQVDEPQEDVNGDSQDTVVEENPEPVEESDKLKPTGAYYLWKDMEDIAIFAEKFSELTKKEHELILSFLKNARMTDPASSIAKRLLEEDSLSLLPMDIVKEAVDEKMKHGEITFPTIINLTTQISGLSQDTKHSLVKVTNAVLPGKAIQWRNNLPDNTLVTKFMEKVKKVDPNGGENPTDAFKAVQDILKVWPGSRG